MARDHLLVIDQGTTSTRVVAFDARLRPVGQGQAEVPPTYPKPGWVEHDPAALVDSVGPLVIKALSEAGIGADRVAGIGLTNQRETTVIWDRATGRGVGPALVWQDRRTAGFCEQNKDRQGWIAERTGLVLDPYFSATKMAWLLDHVPDARKRAEGGELAAGTVDSLLIWHLTGGLHHATDATNASRTLLMDLRSLDWADDLCHFFAVPRGILPEIRPSVGDFGETKGAQLPPRRPPHPRGGRRPASIVGGPGLLGRGPGQVHLRDRGLPPGPHRGRDRPLDPRPDHDLGRRPGR